MHARGMPSFSEPHTFGGFATASDLILKCLAGIGKMAYKVPGTRVGKYVV